MGQNRAKASKRFFPVGLRVDTAAASPALRRRAHVSNLTLTGTTTITVPLFVAQKAGTLSAASWLAQNATDGTKTCQIKNNTQSLTMSSALTVSGVAALASAAFTITTANAAYAAGDVIVAVYTVTSAGTTQPGETSITMQIEPTEDSVIVD